MRIQAITLMHCNVMKATTSQIGEAAWVDLHDPDAQPWDAPVRMHFAGPGAYEKALRIAAAINEAAEAPALQVAAE